MASFVTQTGIKDPIKSREENKDPKFCGQKVAARHVQRLKTLLFASASLLHITGREIIRRLSEVILYREFAGV